MPKSIGKFCRKNSFFCLAIAKTFVYNIAMDKQVEFKDLAPKKCSVAPSHKYCRVYDFFSSVPKEVYANAFKTIDNDAVKKVLKDPELRQTIVVFFHNNLNINAASKELYMHRNTLIYRLEKIKKITGLDLKRFCDSFIFHVLMFKYASL